MLGCNLALEVRLKWSFLEGFECKRKQSNSSTVPLEAIVVCVYAVVKLSGAEKDWGQTDQVEPTGSFSTKGTGTLYQGSPSPLPGHGRALVWDQLKMGRTTAGELECDALGSSWNHPPHHWPWKNYLPRNWSLVPKRLGTAALYEDQKNIENIPKASFLVQWPVTKSILLMLRQK